MRALDPERWSELEGILARVWDLPDEQQVEFAKRTCAGDEPLLRAVLGAIAADRRENTPLDRSGVEHARPLFEEGAEPEPPAPGGRTIGPYRILHEIGRGGMSVVYLAERAEGGFEQRVAIKLVHGLQGVDDVVEGFLRERQILARLSHKGIAPLLDGGRTPDGTPYFALEYVEGLPITRYADAQRLSIEDRLRFFAGVIEAVEYAHRMLIVHRDLKPSNILVTESGEPKLLDFGIATILEGGDRGGEYPPTRMGALKLTPEYAAPEQVRGGLPTTSTDVHGLGAVLYELLTGRPPYRFDSLSAAEIVQVVAREPVRSPSSVVLEELRVEGSDERLRTGSPTEIAARRRTTPVRLAKTLAGEVGVIVSKALQIEPDRRYASAQELREDIERFLTGRPIRARPDSAAYRARKFVGRHRVGVFATAVLLTSLIGGLAGTLWQARIADRQAAQAGRIKDLLVEIFQSPDPERSRGEDITARELLDRGVERVERELAAEPEVRSELLMVMGEVYRNLGLYDRAVPAVESALSARRSELNEGHPLVAASLNERGWLHYLKGEYEQAEALLRQALAMRREALGKMDPDVATSLDNLSELMRVRGDLAQAEALGRQALAVRRALADGPDLLVATSLNNLGVVLRQAGTAEETDSLYAEALAIQTAILGEEHPDVAATLNNIALLRRDQNRFEEAQELLERVHEQNLRLLGSDHPLAITSLNNLAALARDLGDLEGAGEQFREVLALWEAREGASHPNAVATRNNLAVVLKEAGQSEEAARYFRELRDLWRVELGEEHINVSVVSANLAGTLFDLGRYAEAETLLTQALAVFRSTLPDGHVVTSSVQVVLGRVLAARGRCGEARAVLSESLDGDPLAEGDGSDPSEAIPGTSPPGALLALGTCALEAGRADTAERLLVAAHEGFRELTPANPNRLASLRALIDLYTRTGQSDTAELYLAELVRSVPLAGANEPGSVP